MEGIAQTKFTLDLILLTLNICVILVLRRQIRYIRITSTQLKGVEEASLELLQESTESCLLGFRYLLWGFWAFLIYQFIITIDTWQELQKPDPWIQAHPLTLVLGGAALSMITIGFCLYVRSLEQHKPAHLWRPMDRTWSQSGFIRFFRISASVALALAAALEVYGLLTGSLKDSVFVQALMGLWHLGLLVMAIYFIRYSNLGLRNNLLVSLLLWTFAALMAASGQLVWQGIGLVLTFVTLLRLFTVDIIYRLSDLGARSVKLSRDKNIILSFLANLAAGGEEEGLLEGSFDLSRLMQITLEFALKQTQAGSGAIFLISENNPRELFAVAVQGSYPPQSERALGLVAIKEKHIADLVLSERVPMGEGIVGTVAQTGLPLRIEDASQDNRVPKYREQIFKIRNQLAIPIKLKDRVEGVLSVINRSGADEFAPPFDIYDEALLMAVGEQAAIALTNARMHKILAEQEILEREIQIAHEVQTLLLPKHTPQIQGFDFGAYSRSARRVGGDYYDFLWIDDHRLVIVIADVAGKGVPGAITMAMVRSALKAQVHQNKSLREILTELNRFVYQDTRAETFVSMFLAVLDIDRRTLSLSRAGHEPLIYLSSNNGSACQMLAPSGMALGMDQGRLFDEALSEMEIHLGSGDTLVFYTDGVTEAMNDQGEEYQMERFVDTLQKSRSESSNRILDAIHESLSNFTGDLPQHDDLTLVLVKVQ